MIPWGAVKPFVWWVCAGYVVADTIVHRRDASAFIRFPFRCIATVLFVPLLDTRGKETPEENKRIVFVLC